MTDNNHLITPPLELVVKWLIEGQSQHHCTAVEHSINQAARWGADQQLELDATWVDLQTSNKMSADRLRLEMRPVPPSLKEQALQALANADGADHPVVATVLTADQHALIRKALEQLND